MLAIACAMTMQSILRVVLEHLSAKLLPSLRSSSTLITGVLNFCKLALVTAGLVLQRASYLTCETRLVLTHSFMTL